MQRFMKDLTDNQRKTYQKIGLISSLNESVFPVKYNSSSKSSSRILYQFSNDDLMNMCKYSNPFIAPISPIVLQKISQARFGTQQNTCLHIAAQFGNIHLIKHLVRRYNKIQGETIQPVVNKPSELRGTRKQLNIRNKNLDTPLMHCLRTNSEHKMEKVAMYLLKYSDLTMRDRLNRLCFELPLPVYNASRVRLMEYMKDMYEKVV